MKKKMYLILLLTNCSVFHPNIFSMKSEEINNLFEATKIGCHQKIKEFFIKHDFIPTTKNNAGDNLLHVATKNNQLQCIDLLCQLASQQNKQQFINGKNDQGNTALHIASAKGYLDAIKLLLKYGANTNIHDKLHHTPIYLAVIEDHPLCAHMLCVEGNALIKIIDNEGRTPLHWACVCNKIQCFKVLTHVLIIRELEKLDELPNHIMNIIKISPECMKDVIKNLYNFFSGKKKKIYQAIISTIEQRDHYDQKAIDYAEDPIKEKIRSFMKRFS